MRLFRAASFYGIPLFAAFAAAQAPSPLQKRNVIIFVADGLRRGSVNAGDTPTFLKIRTTGVDFRNSHAVFPTFTTANASVIATGHGLGDTGDFSNTLYPGTWLAKPDVTAANGSVTPFLESDELLANMNSAFNGNYLGERTLLSVARENGFNVASVGKVGPTAIQQIEALAWDQLGYLGSGGAIIVDDSTGLAGGLSLPGEMIDALRDAKLPEEAPLRNNGFGDTSPWNNGFSGDAQNAGTRDANRIQQQWFVDVATKVVLPKFTAEAKPFVLVFWSRDPDGSQHNEGDSLQSLTPGINGDTVQHGLKNADRCLKRILDFLDAHPGEGEHRCGDHVGPWFRYDQPARDCAGWYPDVGAFRGNGLRVEWKRKARAKGNAANGISGRGPGHSGTPTGIRSSSSCDVWLVRLSGSSGGRREVATSLHRKRAARRDGEARGWVRRYADRCCERWFRSRLCAQSKYRDCAQDDRHPDAA